MTTQTISPNQPTLDENATPAQTPYIELPEAEALANDLRRILVHSEKALVQGDARESVEKLERWIESYRRGLSAAQKISSNGTEMLQKTRDQLKLSLDELLRLEDEGGNAPTKERAGDSEGLARALRRIDALLPVVEQSFPSPSTPKLEMA
jgi:hypothetical protein